MQRTGKAFDRRVESIKQYAYEQLKIGTEKGEVSRFFTEHRIVPAQVADLVSCAQTIPVHLKKSES